MSPAGVYERPVRLCSVAGCETKHYCKGFCGPHYRRWRSKGDPLAVTIFDPDLEPPGKRRCTKCGEVKDLEDFRLQPKGRLGRARQCKKCDQDYLHTKNKSSGHARLRDRRARARRMYGERGLEIFDRIQAGEGCENCGGRTIKMPIDHDHQTGQARGLICSNCNTALGLLKEDPDTIRGLLRYLEKYADTLSADRMAEL